MGASKMLKLHTTRSWDFIGFPLQGSLTYIDANSDDNLLAQSQVAKDVIIGMIDSGALYRFHMKNETLHINWITKQTVEK